MEAGSKIARFLLLLLLLVRVRAMRAQGRSRAQAGLWGRVRALRGAHLVLTAAATLEQMASLPDILSSVRSPSSIVRCCSLRNLECAMAGLRMIAE